MATRKIIEIDEAKCNGCGACITGCAEGALALVDGKARLVKEQFCDGFGDCIGACPTGALTIAERDADGYDIGATRTHVRATRGDSGLRQFDAANTRHDAGAASMPAATGAASFAGLRTDVPPAGGGCPGSRMRMAVGGDVKTPTPSDGALPGQMVRSDLEQWPVQLHLVQPDAPFFRNRELVVLSTCSPIASADIHWRYLRGRGVLVACPKLDRTEPYAEKLAGIFRESMTPKAIVVRMEVPCCGGLTAIARQALALSGRTDMVLDEVTVAVNGDIKGTQRLAP